MLIMSNSPLVSVILPSYNHVKYVEQAILSVVNQTYSNIELIVIDDGSSDGSADLIEKLQTQYKFLFIKQENRGVYQTISRALVLANGTYISPFSSDDVYCPDKIETLVDLLEQHPEAAVAYGRIALMDEMGRQTKEIVEPYRSGNIFINLLRGDFFINGLAALVRKEAYVSARTKETYVDDFPIWLSIADQHPFIYCKKRLALYRRHVNHTSGNLLKMINSEAAIVECYKDRSEYLGAIKRWHQKWFFNCSKSYKKKALLHLLHSISIRNFFDVRLYFGLIRLVFYWPTANRKTITPND